MRSLKFRAWDGDRYWYNIVPSPIRSRTIDICKEITSHEPEYWNMVDVIEGVKAVEQYTGLKDKNGKEIYEGDVANIQGIKYYVDFEHGGFWFNNDNLKWKANRPFTHFQEINDTEVIGNTHENADLMREK